MDDKDRNLGRLQDIEDKPQVERLDENRAVIRTGTVQEEQNVEEDSDQSCDESDSRNEGNQELSKTFTMKVQVQRNGKVKETKLKSESMRGLIQKFALWGSSVSDENLQDLLERM